MDLPARFSTRVKNNKINKSVNRYINANIWLFFFLISASAELFGLLSVQLMCWKRDFLFLF